MISVGYVNSVATAAWGSWLEQISDGWAGKQNAEFLRCLNAYGFLPQEVASRVYDALKAAPVATLLLEDYVRGSAPAAYKANEIEQLNTYNRWMRLDDASKAALRLAFDCLKEPVTGLLGSPWRVLNVRSWVALPQSALGPYSWHTDGLPKGLLKIMLYWTLTGGNGGGLEVDVGDGKRQPLGGPPGMWVLFYNSKLYHGGIPPTVGERYATEVTLCPWPVYDLEPRSLGMNGAIPIFPVSVEYA